MAKTKSSFLNMVVTLLVVTAVASLALAGVYNLTYEPIQLVKKLKKEKAISDVIPEFDTVKSYEVTIEGFESPVNFNAGYKDGILVGTAIPMQTMKGYSGLVELMVGFLPDGTIYKVEVLQQKETPGLGTKMAEADFKNQYYGKHPSEFDLRVIKDGGNIDAITAATISSRAFSDAVQKAYVAFENQ
jgi:electron transport complex protein RnfG